MEQQRPSNIPAQPTTDRPPSIAMELLMQTIYRAAIQETADVQNLRSVAWRLHSIADENTARPPASLISDGHLMSEDGQPSPILFQTLLHDVPAVLSPLSPMEDEQSSPIELQHVLQGMPAALSPLSPVEQSRGTPNWRKLPGMTDSSSRFELPSNVREKLKLTPEDLCLAEPLPQSADDSSSLKSSPDVFSYIPVNTATSGCQTTFVPEEFFAGAPLLAHTPDKGSRDQVQKRLSYSDSLTPSEDCLLCTSPSCNLFWSPVFSDVSPTTLDTPPLRPVAHRYSSTTPTDILSAVSDINDDFPTTQYIDVSDEETTQLATPSRSPGSAFTTLDWQENELRHVFKKRAYLSAAEKAKLAKRLGITVENVQRWFKNARRRRSREHERRVSGHKDPRIMRLAPLS